MTENRDANSVSQRNSILDFADHSLLHLIACDAANGTRSAVASEAICCHVNPQTGLSAQITCPGPRSGLPSFRTSQAVLLSKQDLRFKVDQVPRFVHSIHNVWYMLDPP